MSIIESAEFVRYNANTSGRRTGDCVKRALSAAFGIDYNAIARELIDTMKKLGYEKWNITPVYKTVIHKHGGEGPVYIDDSMTLAEFVDNVAAKDTKHAYLVETGKVHVNHIVCVIGDTIFDSWDSRKERVFYYYTVPFRQVQLSDIEPILNSFETGEYIEDCVHSEFMRLCVNKYKLPKDRCDIGSFKLGHDGHTIKLRCVFNIPETWSDKVGMYVVRWNYVFKPTTPEEDIDKIIQTTTKTRVYDRLYAIMQEEAKAKEAYETSQLVGPDAKYYHDTHYMLPIEEKFYNTLPGWVRPLIRRIDVQMPGQYNDSYTLVINPLPSDPKHPKDYRIEFNHYNAEPIRKMLQRYKETYEIPYEDYDLYEEY